MARSRDRARRALCGSIPAVGDDDARGAANARFQRLSRLLDEALDLPADARAAYLQSAAGDDATLLAAAQAALADEPSPGAGLRLQVAAALGAEPDDARGSERCGPWRLLHSIGSGGMGEVFLAERADGAFEQQVAVKLLPAAVRTRELGLRLERERQILARLEHPNIARLIDGGVAADGTPYLALEYVEGVPIDRFCAEAGLTLQAKLAIFLKMCDAVAYAHARLAVHRDLKPTNVLVTREGEVKLLDFGIAKLLEEDDLGLTRSVDHLLTPRYAAPEQVEGRAATTATDVHALGLLLFELLTGERPFGAQTTSALSLAREIVERQPARPSQLARSAVPRGASRDLDEICLKALRKRPEERYASVTALADDIRRSLAGYPVTALAGARLYRARKFVARHRLAIAGASLAFVGLATGLLVALAQRDRARASEERSRAIQGFLVDDLLLAATPEEARGRKPLVQEALALAARRAASALATQPEVEHHVRGVLGEAFLRLGELDLAREQIDRERELTQSLRLSTEASRSGDMRALKLFLARAQNAAAAELAEKLDRELAAGAPASESRWLAHAYLGLAVQRQGNYAAAESLLREAEAGLGSVPGAGRARLEALALLVANLTLQRKDIETEPVARRLLEETGALLGVDHPDRVRALDSWAQTLRRLRRRPEARAAAEQAIALGERVLSPTHPATLNSRLTLAFILWDLRDFSAAEAQGEELLRLATAALGATHPTTARAEELFAILLSSRGEFDRAAELYARSLRTFRAAYGDLHSVTLRTLRNQISFARRRGNEAAVEAGNRFILTLAHQALAEPELDPVLTSDLAYFAVSCDPPEQREPALAVALAERAVSATARKWPDALSTLSLAHELSGDPARAIAVMLEAFENPDSWLASGFARRAHRLLDEHGEPGATEAFLDKLAASRRTLYPDDRNLEGETLLLLANHDLDRGRADAALAKLDEADRLLAQDNPPTNSHRVDIALAAADALGDLGRGPEAKERLSRLLKLLESEPASDPDDPKMVAAALAGLDQPRPSSPGAH